MRRVSRPCLAFTALLASRLAAAPPDAGRTTSEIRRPEQSDRYELWAHGETHFVLFRRALLPGPGGSVVSTDTLAPLYQIERLRVRDLDTALGEDSLDIELSTWGRVDLGHADAGRTSGDVQSAYVEASRGPVALRLGRQHMAGGAARYARFDGARLGAELGQGLAAAAYGGYGVLPRWNERDSYQYLGAATSADLRDPGRIAELDRGDQWLAGARFGWSTRSASAALSFHEQHEAGGLARRNLGADALARLSSVSSAGALGILELDTGRVADARVFFDTRPFEALDASLEVLHSEPALLLSRQSVLSVFTADGYDEIGALGTMRFTRSLALEGGGWVERYAQGRAGARVEVATRLRLDSPRTFVRLGYTRVLTPENGYHALRSSLSRELVRALSGTLEAYEYLYDEAIHEVRSSSVYAGTLSYAFGAFEVLWGSSLVRSPFARLDVQTQLRLSYDFESGARREP